MTSTHKRALKKSNNPVERNQENKSDNTKEKITEQKGPFVGISYEDPFKKLNQKMNQETSTDSKNN